MKKLFIVAAFALSLLAVGQVSAAESDFIGTPGRQLLRAAQWLGLKATSLRSRWTRPSAWAACTMR